MLPGNTYTEPETQTSDNTTAYLPPIPVMMRHPYMVASVKQYRSESQSEQLQTHIVSESFIPMAPNLIKPPRKRRRPPFSYSSLIAQAILESQNERLTLRDIYTWITTRYPALYNAEDTGWQVTRTEFGFLRHVSNCVYIEYNSTQPIIKPLLQKNIKS